MFNFYLATISGLSLPTMLALLPPPRDPSVGGKRRRENLPPPRRDRKDDLVPPPRPLRQRQARALDSTRQGQGLGAAFFPRRAAHRCVAPQRQKNSNDDDRGGRRRHKCDNGCGRRGQRARRLSPKPPPLAARGRPPPSCKDGGSRGT